MLEELQRPLATDSMVNPCSPGDQCTPHPWLLHAGAGDFRHQRVDNPSDNFKKSRVCGLSVYSNAVTAEGKLSSQPSDPPTHRYHHHSQTDFRTTHCKRRSCSILLVNSANVRPTKGEVWQPHQPWLLVRTSSTLMKASYVLPPHVNWTGSWLTHTHTHTHTHTGFRINIQPFPTGT